MKNNRMIQFIINIIPSLHNISLVWPDIITCLIHRKSRKYQKHFSLVYQFLNHHKKPTSLLAVSPSSGLTLVSETIEGSNSIQSVDAAMNQFHRWCDSSRNERNTWSRVHPPGGGSGRRGGERRKRTHVIKLVKMRLQAAVRVPRTTLSPYWNQARPPNMGRLPN